MTARRGLLLVVSGPSGVGKTTITRRLRDRFRAVFSVSATTRAIGPGERDGVDYHFITQADFERALEQGRFLEHAQVFGRHWYGTPRDPVERHLAEGRVVILDIDVQGALQVRRSMPEALLIFILPPDDEELLRRLRDRGRDDPEAIARRFAEAQREVAIARGSGAYDAFVVNSDLDAAVERIAALISQRSSEQAAVHGPDADPAPASRGGGA
ncbi:MAG TPA: guanylate kinase [Phycisphaerales bacterium]|nr:guanylate kinase [Phycisphaerales bacterium]HMP38718.1 guanylate kinase [Phycisphaerales bacterium]